MHRLETSSVEMIKALGESLQALHIHDNDCWHDNHSLPFTGSIDFAAIMQTLRDVGYKHDLTLEADTALNGYTAKNAFDGIKKWQKASNDLQICLILNSMP